METRTALEEIVESVHDPSNKHEFTLKVNNSAEFFQDRLTNGRELDEPPDDTNTQVSNVTDAVDGCESEKEDDDLREHELNFINYMTDCLANRGLDEDKSDNEQENNEQENNEHVETAEQCVNVNASDDLIQDTDVFRHDDFRFTSFQFQKLNHEKADAEVPNNMAKKENDEIEEEPHYNRSESTVDNSPTIDGIEPGGDAGKLSNENVGEQRSKSSSDDDSDFDINIPQKLSQPDNNKKSIDDSNDDSDFEIDILPKCSQSNQPPKNNLDESSDDEFDFDVHVPQNKSQSNNTQRTNDNIPSGNLSINKHSQNLSSKGLDSDHLMSGDFSKHLTSGPSLSDKTVDDRGNTEPSETTPLEEDIEANQDDGDLPQEQLDPSMQQAKLEWDTVQTIEAAFHDPKSSNASAVQITPLLSYFEMQDDLRKADYSSLKNVIRTGVTRKGFSALKHFLFGPPKLNKSLVEDRDLVFSIAATKFDNNCSCHTRALMTVYRSLTGSKFDCQRFGSHWEEIGFQGNDPATDLRGAGVLALLNLVNLMTSPRRKILAQDIYKLSLHPTQNFPFCVMSINMTTLVLQCLREDCLNKECNRMGSVMEMVQDYHAAVYLDLYQTWKSQGKTIVDSGLVLKALECSAKKNPSKLLRNLEEYFERKKSPRNLDGIEIGNDTFRNVFDSDAGQY